MSTQEMGDPSDYSCWTGKSRKTLIEVLDTWKTVNRILIDGKHWNEAFVITRLTQQTLKTALMEKLITAHECQALNKEYRLDIWA